MGKSCPECDNTKWLDILCNIAGIHDWGPSIDFDEERFDGSLPINLTNLFALGRAALHHLIASSGNIVNAASAAGMVGVAYNAAYCAAKHGVIGLPKILAIEFAAQGVRINAVCPGMVKTPMVLAPRTAVDGHIDRSLTARNAPKLASGPCDPEDIAAAIAWLGSDDAHKVGGAAMRVDCAQIAGGAEGERRMASAPVPSDHAVGLSASNTVWEATLEKHGPRRTHIAGTA